MANGHSTVIGAGAQPATSPNGSLLAFATGSGRMEQLAVRRLSDGRTWHLGLGRLLGSKGDLLTASISFLGDSREVVIVPGQIAQPVSSRSEAPSGRSCATRSSSSHCLIVVSLARSGRPQTARALVLPEIATVGAVIGGNQRHRRSLMLATSGASRSVVFRIDLAGAKPRSYRLFELPKSDLPVGFDLAGCRLLYLHGHAPPALWVGRIEATKLAFRHLVMRRAKLGEVAW